MNYMALHFMTFALGAIVAYITSVNLPLIYQLIFHETSLDNMELSISSSVWCNVGPSNERLCKFRNICYDPHYHEFQFYLTAESVISGLKSAEAWKDIDISTVLGHNAFKMNIALMTSKNHNMSMKNFSNTPVFIIHRFKSDNLMHVIHDDLLPLHVTYESLSMSSFSGSDYSLLFTDDFQHTVFDEWYDHYSKNNSVHLKELNEPVCFSIAHVGLLRNSLWFKYGFGEPQGPRLDYNVSVAEINKFVKYNLQARGITQTPNDKFFDQKINNVHKIVIIDRQSTRRILNLNIVEESIKKAHREIFPDYNLIFIKVSNYEQNITQILYHIQEAKLLVGMHGAGMIFSLFLSPGSALVELFPFGINPNHVSFMKALCESCSNYPLIYEYWRNTIRGNSRPGPQGNPLTGQISHLHPEQQRMIEEMIEVPQVHCCHQPDYLYYMFQDTIVTEDVIQPVQRALRRTLSFSPSDENIHKNLMFPSSPLNISCMYVRDNQLVNVTWGELSNETEHWDLWFEVTMKCGEDVVVKQVRGDTVKFCLFELEKDQPVDVWLVPFNGGVAGHEKHVRCIK